MKMPELVYARPKLYPKQKAFVDCPARYTVVEASPKTGKTVGCMLWLIEKAMAGKAGHNFWWVAPTLGVADIAFRRMIIWLKESGLPDGAYRINLSNKAITLANSTLIWFKGSDKPDTLYGEDVYAAVMDEATRCKADSWDAVRTTLTATGGSAKIIGNIRGRRNWAYRLARKAQSGTEPNMAYFALSAYDAVDGGIYDRAEIEDAKSVLPLAVFNELYLLEPSDDQGNPFGFAAIEAAYCDDYSVASPAVFGVDLARGGKLNPETGVGVGDWTVVVGLDRSGHPTLQDRWQSPWSLTEERIVNLIGYIPTLVDATGAGDPVTEHLQTNRSNIEGYTFTSTSKQQLMELLAVAIQQQRIKIVGELARREFEAFEYEYTHSGVRYSAPAGEHDDIVCAYALACKQLAGFTAFDMMRGERRQSVRDIERITRQPARPSREIMSRF